MCRKTFEQLRDEGRVDDNNCFILGNDMEVAIFYFRTGYVPSSYKSKLVSELHFSIPVTFKCEYDVNSHLD